MTGHWVTVGDEVYHRKKKIYGRVMKIKGGNQTERMHVLWETGVISWVKRNQVRVLGYGSNKAQHEAKEQAKQDKRPSQ